MTLKLTKKIDDSSTIRKVYNEDKTEWYGLLGTVEDLLKAKVLEYCDYDIYSWVFIPAPEHRELTAHFEHSKEELIPNIKEQLGRICHCK